jgi:hypothetical protein
MGNATRERRWADAQPQASGQMGPATIMAEARR